jgi:hypothetical protein
MLFEDGQLTETCKGNKYLQIEALDGVNHYSIIYLVGICNCHHQGNHKMAQWVFHMFLWEMKPFYFV